MPFGLSAQKTVGGTVSDKSGPLPGVAVTIKGTKTGTSTDFDGKFELIVKKMPVTLVFRYLGYKPKKVVVTNQKRIAVTLEELKEKLQEVVIGYGSVSKKDMTGSITTIKPDDVAKNQAKSIEDVLKGLSAGVQVGVNSNEPGGSISVKIRGIGSLSLSNEPLYVVDGIIMDSATEDVDAPISGYTQVQGGGISGISPEDIESIQVLKDASATAIYGSRGSNGVIIITTKKGQNGKTKFRYTSSFSMGRVTRDINVLDTESYAKYRNDVDLLLGQPTSYTINSDGTIYTNDTPAVEVKGIDWSEDIYRVSNILKNRLTVSGGTAKGNYYVSGGYTSNEGVFPKAHSKAFDFNLNLNQKLSNKIKLNAKIASSLVDLSAAKGTDAFGSANHSMVRQVVLAAPILGLPENNLDEVDPEEAIDGPRAWVAGYDDLGNDVSILGALSLDFKLTKNLSFKTRFGTDYRNKERKFWYGNELLKGKNANGLAGKGTLSRYRYNLDNLLTFKKRFNKHNRFNVMLGALLDKKGIVKSVFSASNFADHSLRADGISFGSSYTPVIIKSEYPTIVSFISRVNYTLFNRYLFTGTFRADGSSKFAKGNRWGYFPSFSFAWRINKESFLKDVKKISNLKLRVGYGEVGNQNIPSYSYLTPFVQTPAGISDAAGGNLIPVVPANLANPDLIWESSVQYNAGIDFGLFENKLSGTIDVYHKTSSNLLLKVPLPPSAGFNFIIANQGNIENRGLEVSLNSKVIDHKKLNLDVFANISFNKNKILNLGDINDAQYGALGNIKAYFGTQISGGTYFKQPANIFIEGREIGLFYGYQTQGIITSNDQLTDTATGNPLKYQGTPLNVGDVYFVDQDGDGNITDKDKTIIGNPNPDFVFGFGTKLGYNRFSLNMMFNGVYGNEIVNGNFLEIGYANSNPKNIATVAYEDAFDPATNPDGKYPYVGFDSLTTDYSRDFNDRMVEDGSYLRLNYVSLSYSVPVEKIKYLNGLTLSVSGKNLLLFSNYKGYDPDVNSFSFDPTRIGVDWGSFPNQKTFSFGVNATF